MGSSYDSSLYLSDLGPTSPSAYLDLPPTPPQDQPCYSGGARANGGCAAATPPDDLVLPYISRMLMDEDIDDKFFYDYPDHPALLRAQQPFLDILSSTDGAPASPTFTSNSGAIHPSTSSSSSGASAPLTPAAHDSYEPPHHFDGFNDLDPAAFFRGGAHSGLMSSAFLKGMEEASKFLPTQHKLVIDLDPPDADAPAPAVTVKEEAPDAAAARGRGRKNLFGAGEVEPAEAEGGRSSKLNAVQGEEDAGVFDQHRITSQEMCAAVAQMQRMRIATEDSAAAQTDASGSATNSCCKCKCKAKAARRRAGGREVVDLRALLTHCAQGAATGDRRSAAELLGQIRQHASPQGDAMQRLAHCFAEGLQARVAGTGSAVYQSLMAKRGCTAAVDVLRAHQLYMSAICFMKVVFIFSNQTIFRASLGRDKIHVVDYGIHYGFQWPCFLRIIADREGGPPAVRITGIDLPQPGFRPTERIEETGRHLSRYAQEFGVPFKYHAIAATRMESVRPEDLSLDPDEVLIVNCVYQFENLMDESVMTTTTTTDSDDYSPRDVVLKNIREMRPDAFVHAVVNGSFGVPFFATRFREALFYYSALFDLLDATTTARDSEQRMLIEQNIFGRAALNVIACEGTDRVERPETYRQWQVRNQRAGLKQLPLKPEIVEMIRSKVRDCYHKDFVIDVDRHWLLQGWKGRILYAVSTWVANDAGS